jgi:hypothetical protein
LHCANSTACVIDFGFENEGVVRFVYVVVVVAFCGGDGGGRGVDDGSEGVLMVVWRRLWWFWDLNDEDWVVFGG